MSTRPRLAALLAMLAPLLAAPAAPAATGRLSPNNEWLEPLGRQAKEGPKGYLLEIHGGGWLLVGSNAVRIARRWTRPYRAAGWRVYNIDYRPGALSYWDSLRALDHLRRRAAGKPICIAGQSAGGHLALLLAAARRWVRCVVTEGAPTNLVSMADQAAYSPRGGRQLHGPQFIIRSYAIPSFGADRLWRWSPIRVAHRIRAQVLMATSDRDPFVSVSQQEEMRRRLGRRRVRTMVLPGTHTTDNFTHAPVSPRSLRAYHAAVRRLLGAVAG
jgi:acetyl esterase/lipase